MRRRSDCSDLLARKFELGFGIIKGFAQGERRGVGLERGHVDCVFCVREKESPRPGPEEREKGEPIEKGIFVIPA